MDNLNNFILEGTVKGFSNTKRTSVEVEIKEGVIVTVYFEGKMAEILNKNISNLMQIRIVGKWEAIGLVAEHFEKRLARNI
ncbi:MAG: hypothetical protein MJ179_02545 [Treponema sp.]|nr:hypothetical protein [Treponema sp.]